MFQAFMTGNAEILRLLLQHRLDEEDEEFEEDEDGNEDEENNTRYHLNQGSIQTKVIFTPR